MSIDKSQLPESSHDQKLTIRRFLTWRTIGVAFVLAGALGAGAAAATRAETEDSKTDEADVIVQRVETTILELTESVQQARTYTGIITARRSADLGFERSARLTAIHFDDGDVVQQGQPIAVLETRRLDAKQRETVARHEAAVAVLDELIAGPREETIAAARAEVSDLQSQLELRKRTFRRTEKLRKQNAATEQDIDTSQLGLQSTEARLNASQKRLDELEAGTRAEQIRAQKANVEQLVATLQDIEIELDESILKAPFTGQIAARQVDEGTVVSPGQAVVRIVEHLTLEARIGLPLHAVQTLSIGDAIKLEVGETCSTGTFVRRLPEIDIATRTQTVVIEIDQNSSKNLVPGQVVQTSINQQIDQRGFLLPTASLLPGVRGLWSLFAVIEKDGKSVIQRRHVEVLHTSGDHVLIRGTLDEGDRVVISGVQRLVAGQQVGVVE
jgi:RND family efflux transporter MFP subunit